MCAVLSVEWDLVESSIAGYNMLESRAKAPSTRMHSSWFLDVATGYVIEGVSVKKQGIILGDDHGTCVNSLNNATTADTKNLLRPSRQ